MANNSEKITEQELKNRLYSDAGFILSLRRQVTEKLATQNQDKSMRETLTVIDNFIRENTPVFSILLLEKLQKSSDKLNKLTYVLIGTSVILSVLTAILALRTF
jgi:hypothetical protein